MLRSILLSEKDPTLVESTLVHGPGHTQKVYCPAYVWEVAEAYIHICSAYAWKVAEAYMCNLNPKP